MPDSAKTPSRVEEPQAAYDSTAAAVTAVRRMEKSGLDRRQAESVALSFRDLSGDLATKSDIARLEAATKSDIARLEAATKSDIARLEARFDAEIATVKKTMATKVDLAEVKSELKSDIADLRSELKSDTAGLKGDLKSEITQSQLRSTMWIVGIVSGVMLTAIAVATAVILAAMPA